jgi:riboflavin-specific deaminase-like protein
MRMPLAGGGRDEAMRGDGASDDAPAPARRPSARPFVTLHYAQSLDGRIATRSGAARWISGPEATRFAHELRAVSAAVLVGSGTALADDPRLTVRLVAGRQPLRVVLDGRGRLTSEANLLCDPTASTLHVVGEDARAPAAALAPHVERIVLPAGHAGGVDLGALLAELARRGVDTLLVEGGRAVLTSFLRAGLVDRLVVSIAPMVVGVGIEAVGELDTVDLDQALRFVPRRVWRLGADVLIELRPASAEAAGEGHAGDHAPQAPLAARGRAAHLPSAAAGGGRRARRARPRRRGA